jgi:hypothetical protein
LVRFHCRQLLVDRRIDGHLSVLWGLIMPERPVMDPRVIRVLLRYHEAVAQAAERAYLDLHRLGVPRPSEYLLGRAGWRDREGSAVAPRSGRTQSTRRVTGR